jgi:NitT/TauT family transport system substrate-binding protein
MKKILFALSVLLTLSTASQKLEKIIIAGPAANVSHPVFKMIEDGALKKYADKIEFKLWKNPDQLRAMIINKEVDFVAIPTNVASILYNKKQPIKMLSVSVWGILKILVRDEKVKHLEDLKGQELVVPWRGDMPDIVLRAIMKKKGLGKEDIKLIYVSNPMDAAQQLIMRRADNILLPEPATSMVLRKTKSFPVSIIAPTVFRGIDLQKEWGDVYKREAKIPQAGMAVVGDMIEKKEIIKAFEEEYAKAMQWYKTHKKDSGELVVKYIDMFNADAIADSIDHVQLDVKSAIDSQEKLNFFFDVLKEDNPKIIGGSVPDEAFYIKDSLK